MKLIFTGKNTTVTDALKEKVEDKIKRVEKLFSEDTIANVTFSVVKLNQTIEVTIKLPKRVLRAEVTKQNMYEAIDEVVDILEKQMVKYKGRLRDKSRRDKSFVDEFKAFENETIQASEDGSIIISKNKKVTVKPMDAEEAVMEMELIGHNFFVFRNSITDDINVVYKRKDGDYGIIESEY